VEEVVDETFIAHQKKPKSPKHLLMSMEEEEDVEDSSIHLGQKKAHHTCTMENNDHRSPLSDMDMPPPPPDLKLIRLHRKCQTPPGFSVLGISVLSAKGWVADLENVKVDL